MDLIEIDDIASLLLLSIDMRKLLVHRYFPSDVAGNLLWTYDVKAINGQLSTKIMMAAEDGIRHG